MFIGYKQWRENMTVEDKKEESEKKSIELSSYWKNAPKKLIELYSQRGTKQWESKSKEEQQEWTKTIHKSFREWLDNLSEDDMLKRLNDLYVVGKEWRDNVSVEDRKLVSERQSISNKKYRTNKIEEELHQQNSINMRIYRSSDEIDFYLISSNEDWNQ